MEHIGAHILHDPLVNHLSEPYGLCLRPAPLCNIVLKKAKGQVGKLSINMEASSCPNLVKFSLAVAARCLDSSPCTNHPIFCHYCDNSGLKSVVWTYNFQLHLLDKHPRVSLKSHNDILVLTKLEKDGMKHVWRDCQKQQKVQASSDYDKEVIESGDEGDMTPVVTEIENGGEGQVLEYAGKWYPMLRESSWLISESL